MRLWVLFILGSTVLLLGQDVERQPVSIEPPEAPEKPQLVEKPAPREQLDFPVPRRVNLTPRSHFSPPPVELPAEPRPQISEAERVKARIDGFFEDLMAHRRARRGNVDPGWRNLERRMDYFFTPDFSLVDDPEITEVSGAWLRKEFWNWISGWYQQVNQNRSAEFQLLDDPREESIDTSLLDMQVAAYQDPEYGSHVTTLVEVRVDTQGSLTATLFRSSGHPRFDRAAMEAVQKAIQTPFKDQLPPGPARSRYAISARYAILPPLPVVGFSFDILLGHFDLMYPFKKMVTGHTRLVAVYQENPDG